MQSKVCMAALFAAVAVAACADHDVMPPPYDVYLGAVPAEDAQEWHLRAKQWNERMGQDVLLVHDGMLPHGACGVTVRPGDLPHSIAQTSIGTCVVRVVYERAQMRCAAAHELGHVLGLADGDSPLMASGGCAPENVEPSDLDAELVRGMWGL